MAEETVVETVKMNDGRLVDFTGAKKRLNVESWEEGGKVTLRLDFRNGETRTWSIPDSLVLKCAAHGAEQKLRDEIAGEKDIDDAVLADDELIDRLNKGEWNMKREAGGMSGTSILIRALVEYTGTSVEEVKANLVGVTHQEKMALRVFNEPNTSGVTLKSIVDRLESEKAAKGGNADASRAVLAKFAGAGAAPAQ